MPEDRIFPLTDRPAPILDRIRGDGDGSPGPYEAFGEQVGKFFKNDDEELEAEQLARAAESFRKGLAEELGIEEDRITDSALDQFAELLTEDDLVEDVEEEDEEEEDIETDFSFEE